MLEDRRRSRLVFLGWCPVLIMVRPVRTSPGCGGLPRGLPEVLAEVRLVGEAALQRDVAQARISREHALSRQFHATSHQENMWRLPEGALERAGEIRLAALNERAKIRYEYRPCDMTIDIGTHLARLPRQQAPASIGNLSRT